MSTSATTSAPAPIPAEQIRIPESRVLRFEGEGHGSSVSFFFVTCDPGQGPRLHRHPYDETFHVIEGEARLIVGDAILALHPGDTAIAPARAWHRFTATGEDTLRIVCIHASPVMIQEDADEG